MPIESRLSRGQAAGSILQAIDEAQICAIAARCIGVSSASPAGPVQMTEVTVTDHDRKTIGIVRVSGRARTTDDVVSQQRHVIA